MENAQRRATRIVPALRGLSYEQRLRELDLPTLEYRRKRYDLIQVYKIVHKIDDIDVSKFFDYSTTGLRGHILKLDKPKAKKALRKNSFALRVVSVWNDLPEEVVTADSVDSFKRRLDKLWKNQRFDISDIY